MKTLLNDPAMISLPKNWKNNIQAAVMHTISLAHYALTFTRSWAVNSPLQRIRLKSQLEQAENEITLLKEEIRLKDQRMYRIDPHHRPHYTPHERMAIMEIKAARHLSQAQTAKMFHIAPATVAAWSRRLDESGPDALLQIKTPVNKFPELIKYIVQRLKVLCPGMGKVKIARLLSRAGLHLAAATVHRMLQQDDPDKTPAEKSGEIQTEAKPRHIIARYPNHLWHVDLTAVPTAGGFWTSWPPLSLPQVWPFGLLAGAYRRSLFPPGHGLCPV